jgi:CO/xanthine dehydrogenase Mo-binding subunit
MSADHRVVGQRLPRLDGAGKVTGKARYGVDQSLPGMLYGKLVRSTVPHAHLRAIRTDAARALPGVRAIVTAADHRRGRRVSTSRTWRCSPPARCSTSDSRSPASSPRRRRKPSARPRRRSRVRPAAGVVRHRRCAQGGCAAAARSLAGYKALPCCAAIATSQQGESCWRRRGRLCRIGAHLRNRFVTSIVHPGYAEPRTALPLGR